ncbi:MAG: hypothetical protein R3C11_09590 [Planctomycetaceae bacterium]
MPRSLPSLLIFALLWSLLIGGWALILPLELPEYLIHRFDIALLFPEMWHDYIGENAVSLDQFIGQRLDVWSTSLIGLLTIWTSGRLWMRLPWLKTWAATLSVLDYQLFAYGLGTLSVTSLLLMIGLTGLLTTILIRFLCAIQMLLELYFWIRNRNQNSTATPLAVTVRQHLGLLMCACPFLIIMIAGATQPPLDFDVREYHLEGPKEFYLQGKFDFLEHNVYTNFPALTEVISLLGMLLRDDWYRGALAGKLMLMPFIPMTGIVLGSLAQKLFNETCGWWAFLLWISTPWAYRLATIAYVEGGMLYFLAMTMLVCYLAYRKSDEELTTATSFLMGLFAGGVMACKYPGLVWGVLPVFLMHLYVLNRNRKHFAQSHGLKPLFSGSIWFLAGTTLAVGPWLFKNLIFTGNPVFPLAYGLFGGSGWTEELHRQWQAGHSAPGLNLTTLPAELYRRFLSDPFQTPILLTFAPLAFCNSSFRKQALLLTGFACYLMVTWWVLTHRIDRFWLPALLPLMLLASGGMNWETSLSWFRFSRIFGLLLVGVNLSIMISTIGTPYPVGSDMQLARQQAEMTTPLVHQLNQMVPAESKVLLVGEAQVFDAQFKPVYNTVFNQDSLLLLVATQEMDATGKSTWKLKPGDEAKAALKEAGIEYIAVNWNEILRYRLTYGFEEEITPRLFDMLTEQKVLAVPTTLSAVKLEELTESKLEELKKFAPELIQSPPGSSYVITQQLYEVTPAE